MGRIDIRGKTVFISGGSSGIGKELARSFARSGADVIMMSREGKRDAVEEFAKTLKRDYSVDAASISADLAERAGPETAFERAMGTVPRVDVLVNNAGAMSYGAFHESPLEDLERILLVNVRASMKLMRLFLPAMVSRGSGAIFNVCSFSAFAPTPRHAVYGATKSFIQSLSDAVREELRGSGVSVFTLNPGYTDTPMISGDGFPRRLRFYQLAGRSDPATVADKGVRAFLRGRRQCVPGARLKMLSVVAKLAPKPLVCALSGLLVREAP